MVRILSLSLSGALLAGVALAGWMYRAATSDPVVRNTSLHVPELSAPLRLVLVSDIHVAGPDMPPARLGRIVDQINRLQPDMVLIAGDFVSDKRTRTATYSFADAAAPLGKLKARNGVFAVLGNHDHWRDAAEARRQLSGAGIRILDNDVVRAGPLTLGGVDDAYTGRDDLRRVVESMKGQPAPHVLLTHSPDIFPRVPNDVRLTLAGHTHCGQIALPFVGPIATMSDYGRRYACGRIEEQGRTLIVSAGLGTSVLPLRLGTLPDLWVISLLPAGEAKRETNEAGRRLLPE